MPVELVHAFAFVLQPELAELHFDHFLLMTKFRMAVTHFKRIGDNEGKFESVLGMPD